MLVADDAPPAELGRHGGLELFGELVDLRGGLARTTADEDDRRPRRRQDFARLVELRTCRPWGRGRHTPPQLGVDLGTEHIGGDLDCHWPRSVVAQAVERLVERAVDTARPLHPNGP